MPLIDCPDCGKKISDSAPTCIGCGRVIGTVKESVVIENAEEPVIVERKGGKYEMIGTLIILASMGGCAVGMSSSGMGGTWFGVGTIGFVIGIVTFLYGRFF